MCFAEQFQAQGVITALGLQEGLGTFIGFWVYKIASSCTGLNSKGFGGHCVRGSFSRTISGEDTPDITLMEYHPQQP